MKTKLFTLLTLLLCLGSSGAWADDEFVLFDGTNNSVSVPVTTEQTDATTGFVYQFAAFKSTLIDVSEYSNAGTYKKAIRYNGGTTGATNGIKIVIPIGYTAKVDIVYGVTEATNYFGIDTGSTKPNGSSCTTWNATVSTASSLSTAQITSLETGTYYIGGSKDKCVIAYLKVTLEEEAFSAPVVSTQPQNGVYQKNATGKTLTVAATPSTGECAYQWYSCDDTNKTNPVSLGSSNGAQTAAFALPTSTDNTFYYFCRVSDGGENTTDTEVAKIIIVDRPAKQTWDFTTISSEDIRYNSDSFFTSAFYTDKGNSIYMHQFDKGTYGTLLDNYGNDLLNGIQVYRSAGNAPAYVYCDATNSRYGINLQGAADKPGLWKIPVENGKYYKVTYTTNTNSTTLGYIVGGNVTAIDGNANREATFTTAFSEKDDFVVHATADGYMTLTNRGTNANNCTLVSIEEVPVLYGAWTPSSSTVWTGDSAPSPSFAVSTSNSSDPSGLYTVTYSKVVDDDNIVAINASTGITAIDMNKSGTATIRATLSSDSYVVATAAYDYTININEKIATYTLSKADNEISLRSTPVHRSAEPVVNEEAVVTMEAMFLEGTSGTVTVVESVSGLSVSPAVFTITDGTVAETEFTITYNSDSGASGEATIRFSDGTNTKDLIIEYSSVVSHGWSTVTGSTTWDWSNLKQSSTQLTDDTTPAKSEEFLMGDMTGDILAQDIEYNPSTFNADALKVVAEYVTRVQSNVAFMQGTKAKFKTSVPGTVQVWFSNTSGREDTNANRRYIYVNGSNTETYSLSTTHTMASADVSAGEVTITAKTGTGDDTMVRISKIVFTPTAEPSTPVVDGETITLTTTANMDGWRAYYNASNNYSVDGDTKVYVPANDPQDGVLKLTSIAGVPAGVPVILRTTAVSRTMTLTQAEENTYSYAGSNKLAVTTDAKVSDVYRLGYKSGEGNGVGFYPYTGTPGAGIVYLNVSSAEARALTIVFDDEETTGIAEVKGQKLELIGDFFDLQGRKVAQPSKGLYIVNGRKVLIK